MNVAIVGATGYGGIQAVNLLKDNKNYKITYLGGNKSSGSNWSDNFPFINLESDIIIEKISIEKKDHTIVSLQQQLNNKCVEMIHLRKQHYKLKKEKENDL